ncbi:MAG: class I mannose-6-phosphate isomerase [Firmicutes bacterium]|nr:class I mannose-6-phosphate isomerase [Bacillota bacterium]
MDLSPIKLKPACKDYIWGGTRLKREFGKGNDLEKVAESWELSAHKDGESIVSGGAFDGLTLTEYIAKNSGCIGKNAEKFEFFPILIKLIDAADNLSIQVHPSDEYALKNEGEYGKTEMWYVVDCEEDAFLYYGFSKQVTKDEFKSRIENNTLLEILNKVKIKKGDVFFIESGTIHAIGKGAFICEVQQNSNKTYRVYDYDRRDKNGNARELHIDKALDVTNLEPPKTYKTESDKILAKCKYFTVEKLSCTKAIEFELSTDSFRSVIVLSGEAKLKLGNAELDIKKGDSIFVPAQDGLAMVTGKCEIIVSYV